jgi:AraC-like DNA-binding protein
MNTLQSHSTTRSRRSNERAHRSRPRVVRDIERAEEEIERLTRRLAECESTLAQAPGEGSLRTDRDDATNGSSFLERARVAVASALADGRPTIRAVGRALHASPRTVQRRLGQQGTTYVKVVESVRRARVERLVTDGRLSITEIAFLAGFADVSGFRRAYKRWTGLAPAGARARENMTANRSKNAKEQP